MAIPLLENVKFVVSWFLDLEVSKFPIFRSFPKFQRLLISKLSDFKVSWFQSSRVPKFQRSHITKIPFHVLWKILIPYSRCSRSFKTDRHDFSVPAFANKQKLCISKILIFMKIFKNWFGLLLGLFEVSWGLKRQIILVLALKDTSRNPEIIEMMSLIRVLP